MALSDFCFNSAYLLTCIWDRPRYRYMKRQQADLDLTNKNIHHNDEDVVIRMLYIIK